MRRAIHIFQRNPKLLLVALLVVSTTFVLGGNAKVHADSDCSPNAIITCGLGDGSTSSLISTFLSKVNNNSDGHGHTDLKAIYSHYNLVPAEYQAFATSAKLGTAYRDGHIVVNGQTIANGPGFSIGRVKADQGSGNVQKIPIGSGTYYGNINSQSFAANHASLPVLVLFDSRGVMLFAVITTCGNPITGAPVTPAYGCHDLAKTPVTGKANTYTFTAHAAPAVNSTIVQYTFDFGDGASQVIKTSSTAATTVAHTYTTPGNHVATVRITVTLPGGATGLTATSVPCSQTIVVAPPPPPPPPPAPKTPTCVQLTSAIVDATKNSYTFTATAGVPSGNKFNSVDFNFGDSTPVQNVPASASSTMVAVAHSYGTAGNYTITATLHFTQGTTIKNVVCTTSVTKQACSDTVAPFCHPCASNPAVPASDTANCTTSLPNTGAGDVIAIFGAVVVAGFLIFRQFIYRRNAVQVGGAAAGLTDHPVHGDTVEPSVDDEPTLVQQVHRNQQGLNGTAHYQRPHRFRPRSHKDD